MLLVGLTLVATPWLLGAIMYKLEDIHTAWLQLHGFQFYIDVIFMSVFISGCGILLAAIIRLIKPWMKPK